MDGSNQIVSYEACRLGTYKSLLPGGHFHTHKTFNYVPCPVDSYPSNPPTQCVQCLAFLEHVGQLCRRVVLHQRSPPIGVACTQCPAGLIAVSPSSNQTCQACQAGKYALVSSEATACLYCTLAAGIQFNHQLHMQHLLPNVVPDDHGHVPAMRAGTVQPQQQLNLLSLCCQHLQQRAQQH